MPITQSEFEAILADESKRIRGDLYWQEDDDHSPALEFVAAVESEAGYPLFVKGRLNRLSSKLSYTVIHRSTGRIYALDLGADHHNPTCQRVGEKHKHSWTDQHADKLAYMPKDVASGLEHPDAVWQQFCAEAKIVHDGSLHPPPPMQEELL